MKHATVILLSSLACFSPVFASEQPVTAGKAAVICPDQGTIASAVSNIANHASYALLSVAKGQTSLTVSHLAEVEKQLDLLIDLNPIIASSDQVKMARLDYIIKDKATYSMLLPLNSEESFQGLYALSAMNAKDSTIVTMHMRMDSEKMKKAVEQAWQYLAAKDMVKLAAVLQEMQAMTGNTEISAKPDYLGQLYDYMLLTDNLLKKGLVNYASFALKHVKITLKAYAATIHDPNRSNELKQLTLSVDTLSEQLKQQKSGVMEKAAVQFHKWMQAIKSWQPKAHYPYDFVKK